jgi:hypothetical protein
VKSSWFVGSRVYIFNATAGFDPGPGLRMTVYIIRSLVPWLAASLAPRIETGGTFAADFADGRRDRHNIGLMRPQPLGSPCTVSCMIHNAARWLSRQIQQKAQDYSGFELKLQTPTPKSAQLTSLAPVRGAADPPNGLLAAARK